MATVPATRRPHTKPLCTLVSSKATPKSDSRGCTPGLRQRQSQQQPAGGFLMPVHDWTRVDAGTFHGFHTAWLTHLSETLNGGRLPKGYYALPEQHGGRLIADVLTL